MRFHKVLAIMLLVSLMLLTAAGCGAPKPVTESTPQPQADPVTVKIGILPDIDSLPFIVAEQEGYFQAENVNVEIVPFKSAMDRDAALQSKSVDGCVSDLLAATFLQAGGFDVAVTSATDGRYMLLAAPNSPIEKVEDFKGKSIGISEHTIIEFATQQILMKNGFSSRDMNLVAIPKIPVRLEMLQQGKLNGATLPEPLATLAVTRGAKIIADSQKEGLPPGIMVFNREFAEKHKGVLQALYRAYNKAVDALNERGDEFRGMLTEKAGFPPEVEKVLVFPAYRHACLPEAAEVQVVIDWMKGQGLLKTEVTPEDLLVNVLE